MDHVTKEIRPEDVKIHNDTVFIRDDGLGVIVSEPTFFKLGKKEQKAVSKEIGKKVKRLNVIRISKTPHGCPYGVGLKVYVLEYNMIVVAQNTGFLWLHVEQEALPHMGI